MSINKEPLARAGGPSTLARARFGPGMLLQHDDLEQLNVYPRELNRLMMRALFGCGVVCGLVVAAVNKARCNQLTITVEGGLALNSQGDPIHVPRPQTMVIDEDCWPNMPDSLWVVLCGSPRGCAPRTAMCGDDEDEPPTACTRECDYFEIRVLAERPNCGCDCLEPNVDRPQRQLLGTPCQCANPEDPCHAEHYAGKCGPLCGQQGSCADDCVLLARLDRIREGSVSVWFADHRVRRFVRPVLMGDPQVALEGRGRNAEGEREGIPDEPRAVAGAPAGTNAATAAEPTPAVKAARAARRNASPGAAEGGSGG